MARPTKLSPEIQRRIVAAIRAGNYAEPAARSAGISVATFHRWMKRGSDAKSGAHRDFYEAVKQAEADAEVEAVALIRKEMPKEWRAALAYLERRYPERWRRRQSHEHTGPDGGAVQITDPMMDDPELRKDLREALRRAGRARADQSDGAGAGD